MIYSPHHPTAYRLHCLKRDEFTVMAEHAHGPAIWNMYWMSNPTVDVLVKPQDGFPLDFHSVPDLSAAIIGDVIEHHELLRRLHMSPLQFLSWWNRIDPSVYEAYDAVGPHWPALVRNRAHEAATRHHLTKLAVSRFGGKWVTFNLDQFFRTHDTGTQDRQAGSEGRQPGAPA